MMATCLHAYLDLWRWRCIACFIVSCEAVEKNSRSTDGELIDIAKWLT